MDLSLAGRQCARALCRAAALFGLVAAACSKPTEAASPPFRSPVNRLCVGPAGSKFDPGSSERTVGVPRLVRSAPFSWVVDGYFTTQMPSGGSVLPDCGEGHFGYRLGKLENACVTVRK